MGTVEIRRFTVADLTREFNLSRDTVMKRLADVPAEESGKRRVWKLADAAPALLQVNLDVRLDPAQEIARSNRELAEQRSLANAVTRREQVPLDIVTAAIARAAAQMAGYLDAVPGELKRANPALTQTDIAMVKRALAEARNAAASIELDWSELE